MTWSECEGSECEERVSVTWSECKGSECEEGVCEEGGECDDGSVGEDGVSARREVTGRNIHTRTRKFKHTHTHTHKRTDQVCQLFNLSVVTAVIFFVSGSESLASRILLSPAFQFDEVVRVCVGCERTRSKC